MAVARLVHLEDDREPPNTSTSATRHCGNGRPRRVLVTVSNTNTHSDSFKFSMAHVEL
jgi:hypothetical protein